VVDDQLLTQTKGIRGRHGPFEARRQGLSLVNVWMSQVGWRRQGMKGQ